MFYVKQLFITQQKQSCALLHSTTSRILLEEGLEPKSNIFHVKVLQNPGLNVLYKLMHIQYVGTNCLSAVPLTSKANIIIRGLAVPLTFKNINGLVIGANFFSQSTNPLEKKSCHRGFYEA